METILEKITTIEALEELMARIDLDEQTYLLLFDARTQLMWVAAQDELLD